MLRVLYRFKSERNGQDPSGPLVALRGVLYGTTFSGGPESAFQQYNGTVYSFDPSTGTDRVIYDFKGGTDGAFPTGGLVAFHGMLYGTTQSGGSGDCAKGCGTVFSIDPSSGSERVLHRFTGADGADPQEEMIVANGLLYGTATSGGIKNSTTCSFGCGTVFSIDPSSGHLRVVHKFSDSPDGVSPRAPLIDVDGTLYGTTQEGGDRTNCSIGSCGTVFAIDLGSGQERIAYSFEGGVDGATPTAGLTFANGKLYGTTAEGGRGTCDQYNNACGTVFSIVPNSGKERVVHRFAGHPDGADPESGLIAKNGFLYGTTRLGGVQPSDGAGTVFAINASTRGERIVYAFPLTSNATKAPRGESPAATLIVQDGLLYGTTAGGGKYSCGFEHDSGCGTLFSITP
jgi:uncharacterized repeat protein (TIGR03803 family)